jgi:hypothetical protein
MGFCSKCGTQLIVGAAFCSACGIKTIIPTPSAAAQLSVASVDISEYLETFVGNNYEYYKLKWHNAGLNKRNNSWNWAASDLVLRGCLTGKCIYILLSI